MSISGLSENVSIHQTLGDNPNTDNNLSADELKALFDQAAEILKAYLNNIVVPEINRLAPLAEAGDENSEEALSKLAEMQNSITWALNKVDSALTTAESAKTIAEEAEVKSNGAYSFASQANQQAKNAGYLARTAISQASGAVQLANQAKEAADNANENSAEALEKMNNSLPLSGGILTGPLQGIIASMDLLVARSRLVLDDTGYGKIYAKNVSDEGDPAIDLSDREAPGGNPVRVTGVKTPVQDNDAANKSYVDAKIGSGSAGKDGGYYAISVSQPSNDKMRVTLTPSKSDMPTVPAVDIDLPAGEDGQDGKSPTVTVTDITGGHRITVTDATGTKTFNVMDGTPGAPGVDGGYYTPVVTQVITGSMHVAFVPSDDSMPVIPPVEIPLPAGEDGEDGVSPTVSVTDITGGHRITITDASGQKTFDVMDGGGGSVDIDDTLTQSGKAADAKTVGDALKLKYGIDGGDIQAINVTSSLTTDSGINVDFNGNRLKDVGDPVENGDAVNKKTLDQAIAGVAAGSTMIPDGYCSTPAATAAKLDTFITASVTDGTPVMVNFVHQNTAENPTLTVNGVTAPILGMDAQPIAAAALTAGLHTFIYYTRYPGWVMLPMQDFKPWKLLGTVDCSEASGNIEFSNLKDITEIFVQSSEVHNDNATDSGYNLVVNDINVGSAAVSISNNTNQNANHQWMYAKYNGMVWMLIRSAQAVASTNVALNSANANLPYNLVQNVGPAKKFKLDAPASAYVAVTGTITIWVR